jgi:hypothetical protein
MASAPALHFPLERKMTAWYIASIIQGLSIFALCIGLWVLAGAVHQLQKLELERKNVELENLKQIKSEIENWRVE